MSDLPDSGGVKPNGIREPERLEAWVSGHVQGVYFRVYARQRALALGLTGYVENLPDGSVHVVAQGERASLLELLSWLRRGPSMALVSDVEIDWGPVREGFASFEVHP